MVTGDSLRAYQAGTSCRKGVAEKAAHFTAHGGWETEQGISAREKGARGQK